ncbi:hypothetical protein FQR65_LT06788 [Abscondita terminalis]|nr:hypothetical protein FQR65_LT06788 [Abscondita terminalis]
MKTSILFFVCCVFVAVKSFVCDETIFYQENGCNICFCRGQYLFCHLLLCQTETYKNMTKCIVGTSWQSNCNDCWCLANVGTLCTYRQCFLPFPA